ncbi:MAG: alpha/beta fold hydrolase [Oscillochloris sp.]|nr:alpha/beta fold hydrolase [Oscillochloris sp.]
MPEALFTIPAALEPHVRRVTVNGLPIHCYIAGPADAAPLVLVHGLADEADSWRRVILPLAERHRVVALDLPGFGRSAAPQRALSLAFFARTLAGLLDALAIPRAILVGNSVGAMICQRLAVAAPQRVERLVLIGGCLPVARQLPPPALLAFLLPGLGEFAYTSLRRSQAEAYATLRPYYHNLDGLPAEERDFLYDRVWARVWSDRQRRAFCSTLRWLSIDGAARSAEYRSMLRNCAVPTHLVWGESDGIAARANAETARALIPNSRLSLIPECGHLPQQERPLETIEKIREME